MTERSTNCYRPLTEEILSVDEVAELLRCEPETIELKARNRTLPGLKFGRPWIFPREALLQFLAREALEAMSRSSAAVIETAQPRRAKRNVPPVLG